MELAEIVHCATCVAPDSRIGGPPRCVESIGRAVHRLDGEAHAVVLRLGAIGRMDLQPWRPGSEGQLDAGV